MATQSSTKNTKDNRKVVVATFYPPQMVFKLPDGLDLEDKSVVGSYSHRYDTLYIYYVDGREEKIRYEYLSTEDFDYKYSEELSIGDAEDYCVEYSDEEEEEEH